MEFVYHLLDALRKEFVFDQLINPPDELRSEFGMGKLHGMLFMLETVREQLQIQMEANAQRETKFEREF